MLLRRDFKFTIASPHCDVVCVPDRIYGSGFAEGGADVRRDIYQFRFSLA